MSNFRLLIKIYFLSFESKSIKTFNTYVKVALGFVNNLLIYIDLEYRVMQEPYIIMFAIWYIALWRYNVHCRHTIEIILGSKCPTIQYTELFKEKFQLKFIFFQLKFILLQYYDINICCNYILGIEFLQVNSYFHKHIFYKP